MCGRGGGERLRRPVASIVRELPDHARASRFPTSPTPVAIATPGPTPAPIIPIIGTFSAVVFEVTAGENTPVESVQVYCDACGSGHVSIYTDRTGTYTFTEVRAGTYPLLVARAGYVLANATGAVRGGWLGSVTARVEGDTSLTIALIRQ